MCGTLKTVSTLALTLGCLASAVAVAQDAQLSTGKPQAGSVSLQPGDGFFPLADLRVDTFRATAGPTYSGNGYFSLPVRFTVSNHGQRPAAAFKVAVYVYESRGPMQLVKFTTATPGQKPGWFAWSPPLDPGDRQTFVGRLSLSKTWAGQMVRLYLHADSTIGEEPPRKNGRVSETSEKNNWSTPIRVRLPRVLDNNAPLVAR
jgi:hypothetical protein